MLSLEAHADDGATRCSVGGVERRRKGRVDRVMLDGDAVRCRRPRLHARSRHGTWRSCGGNGRGQTRDSIVPTVRAGVP